MRSNISCLLCPRDVGLGRSVHRSCGRAASLGAGAGRGCAAEVRQGRATDRSNLRVTSGPLARRPICLSSIIESNGVGDSTWLNKIFHICAIVNLVTTISVGRLRIKFISGISINQLPWSFVGITFRTMILLLKSQE